MAANGEKRITEERYYYLAMLATILGVSVTLAGLVTKNGAWQIPALCAFATLGVMCPIGVLLMIRHRQWPPSLLLAASVVLSALAGYIVVYNVWLLVTNRMPLWRG